jgi:hypothetical protein
MVLNESPRTNPDSLDNFESGGMDFADESIARVRDDVMRQFAASGLDDEQAEFNAQFLANGLSTFAHRAGMSTEELYRALGLKIVRGEIAGKIKMYAQPAYHGSPHRFDRFSLDRIGSGQGAQSYGWGLYFAERRDTAESYRNDLSGNEWTVETKEKTYTGSNDSSDLFGRILRAYAKRFNGDAAAIADAIEGGNYISFALAPGMKARLSESVGDIRSGAIKIFKLNNGELYAVDIPDADVLLDWDKPLCEQPEPVKNALLKTAIKHSIPLRGADDLNSAIVNGTEYATADDGKNWIGKDGSHLSGTLYTAVKAMKLAWGDRERAESLMRSELGKMTVTRHGAPAIEYAKESLKTLRSASIEFPALKSQTLDEGATMKGQTFYAWLSEILGSDKAASLALNEAGIPGIQYLDGGSRDSGEGTHNYVIFDDKAIKILETYYQAASGGDLSERTMQAISSANTSLNQIPASFKTIGWEPGAANADIGGGRFDAGTEFLSRQGVRNLVFDPFNRDEEFNRRVFGELKKGTDTATVSNVLNVIAEPEIRREVIRQAAKAIKPGGTAYFQIYEGDGDGVGRQTTKGWQNNAKTASYLEDVEKYFSDVTRKGNVIAAKGPMPGNAPALWMMDSSGLSVEYYQTSRRTSTETGPRGAIDFTNSNSVEITLTPRSDATTTIHEMGHLFRWLLEQQAAVFPNDEQLQADWKAVREFGDHEKFADAAIEYAMTGKAPSSTLIRAFSMFKQCLVRFYDAIRGNTGVKLTDEIRGVFDKILAGNTGRETAAIPISNPDPPKNDAPQANQDRNQTKTKEGDFMTVNLFDDDAVISAKVQKTADIFHEHIADVGRGASNWASFLETAGRMYKYSFVDQILIHAQRPEATACAGIDFWNERMNRWVKRGSKGIALIDRTNPHDPRLKYVFDVNDTHQSRSAQAPYIWRIEPEHAEHVRKRLAMAYGIDDPDMKAQLTGIVKRMTVDYIGGGEYKNLVADSAVYCIMSRCGFKTDGLRKDAEETFSGISIYDTDEKILELGLATVELSEKILRNIERTVRAYDQWKSQRNERRNRYDRAGVREGRGLQDTGADIGRDPGEAVREVRPDEIPASAGQRQIPVQPAGDTRAVGQPPRGDRRDGGAESGAIHGGIAEEKPDTRGTQEHRPAGMGGTDGEPEGASRGNSDGGADLHGAGAPGLSGRTEPAGDGRGTEGTDEHAVLNTAAQRERSTSEEAGINAPASSDVSENPDESGIFQTAQTASQTPSQTKRIMTIEDAAEQGARISLSAHSIRVQDEDGKMLALLRDFQTYRNDYMPQPRRVWDLAEKTKADGLDRETFMSVADSLIFKDDAPYLFIDDYSAAVWRRLSPELADARDRFYRDLETKGVRILRFPRIENSRPQPQIPQKYLEQSNEAVSAAAGKPAGITDRTEQASSEKPEYALGDTVYLEDGNPYKIEEIGDRMELLDLGISEIFPMSLVIP